MRQLIAVGTNRDNEIRERNLPLNPEDTIAQWRTALLDKFALYFFVATLCIAPFLLYENGIIGDGSTSILFLFTSAAFYVTLRTSSQKHLLRCALFACGAHLGSATAFLQAGFWAPEALIAMGFIACAMALVLGRNYAWLSLILSTAVLLGFAIYFISGGEPKNFDNHELGRALNWARIIAIFIGTSAVTATAIAHQAHNLESGVSQRNKLIEQIEEQSREKLTALSTQQKLESKLQEARKLEALGQLAGGVAHDFNNLLVVIINTSLMLQEEATGEELEDLKQIEDAGERASELAKQLLRFGQHRTDTLEPFAFNRLLQDTFKLLDRLLPANIVIDLSLSDTDGWILGSKIEFGQVIMNLCLNARDAMPEGGTLSVTTQHQIKNKGTPESFLFCLSDTGTGIPPELVSKIYDPFFTTKAVDKGTGLGLSVVHGVITQHKGTIAVTSTPGEGSCFQITLPLCDEPAPKPARAASTAPTNRAREKTFLVVDDNPDIVAITRSILEKQDHKVVTCSNGAEALTEYKKNRRDFHLVITDAIMPVMGGREFYEQAQKLGESPPFIFCSGYDSGSLPPEFFLDSSRALVMKPFREEELLGKIDELLANASRDELTVNASRDELTANASRDELTANASRDELTDDESN